MRASSLLFLVSPRLRNRPGDAKPPGPPIPRSATIPGNSPAAQCGKKTRVPIGLNRETTTGFAVIGFRGSLRSRGRVGAAVAADAAVTALDTSSLRRVADNGHSSAVAAPIRRSRRHRFPLGKFRRICASDPPGRALEPHRNAARCKARQHLPLSALECAPAPLTTTEDDRSIADRAYAARYTFVPVRLAPPGDAWRPFRMIDAYFATGRLPGAWRCNTLGNPIVCSGIGRIVPPVNTVRARSSPSPGARRYRRPGGGGGPRPRRRS